MSVPKLSPLKQIRRFCLYCQVGSVKGVRLCCDTNCPNWYFRFGKFPKPLIRKNINKYGPLFNKCNCDEKGHFYSFRINS